MYLKRVILHGFKSFADRTELEFRPGITAVVGPNGGGKSNITDALRFCLGEGSTKALRGSRMDELIFSGSSKRGPFSMAEVIMLFDNSDEVFPLDYNEVSVARRIYRDDSNQHLINKKTCRLKDIQELFMGTGVGQGGLSFLSQEEVGMVLSDASTRRSIMEEVAGTNKYKFRKKEALRKLEHTEDNLKRLRDILYEVQNQLASLERQVKKYRRYKKAKERLVDLEKNYYLWQVKFIKDQLEPINKKEEELRLEKNILEEKINSIKINKQEIELCFYKKETQINNFQQNLSGKQLSLQNHLNFLDLIKEREENARQALKESASEIEVLNNKLDNLKNEHAGNQKEFFAVNKAKEEINQLIAPLEEELASLIESQDELCPAEEEYFKSYQKYTELKSNRDFLFNKIKQIQKNIEHLKEANERNALEEEDIQKKIQDFMVRVKEEEEKISSLHAKLEGGIFELEKIQEAYKKKNKDYINHQEELYRKIAQLNALQKLEEEMDGFSGAVKVILKHKEKFPHLKDAVSNLFKVRDEYNLAIEAVIGKHFEDLVVTTSDEAYKYIEHLKSNNLGKVTFWPQDDFAQLQTTVSNLHFDGFIGWAKDLVNFAPKNLPLFNILLANTLVVKDFSCAKEIRAKFKEHSLNIPKIVTLDGDIIEPQGAITGGSIANHAGSINRREKIHNLKVEIHALEDEVGRDEKQRESLGARINQLSEERAFAGTQKNQSHGNIKKLQNEIEILKSQLKRAEDLSEKNKSMICSLDAELETTLCQKEKENSLLLELEEECSKLSVEFDSFKSMQQQIYKKAEEIRAKSHEYKIKRAEFHQEEKSFREKEKFYTEQVKECETKINTLKSYSHELENKIAENLLNKEKTDKLIIDLQEELKSSQDKREALIEEKEGIQRELKIQETQLQDVQDKQMEEQALWHDIRVRKVEFEVKTSSCFEKLEELGLTRESADTVDLPQIDTEKVKIQIERLKKFIDNFGGVNLAAEEDYRQLDERHKYMSQQIEDLQRAKESLLEVIKEYDQECIKKFKDTFDKTNQEFSSIFTRLFNGGQAQLKLSEPEDLLETGVEIIARPPGKKLRNIALLSGGEKALTSVAFLFAILKIKASPFVMLDELDAPLDDSNIERVVELIKEYSKTTQFIIVTHNKKTMEAAQSLYGITMEEKGVSKLISVSLEEAA